MKRAAGLFTAALAVQLCCAIDSARAGASEDLDRMARLVSRDARFVLFVDDRAAFLRRAQRTALGAVVETFDESRGDELVLGLAPQFRALVPTEVLREAAWLLRRGDGPIALAVDEFVQTERGSEPDWVIVADARGLEGLVRAFRYLASDEKRADAQEALATFELPFDVDDAAAVGFTSYRGLDLVEIDDAEHEIRFAIAQVGGVVIAGKTAARVREAVDRAIEPSRAGLAQNRRFQSFWREVGGRNGALFGFADLRRLRQSLGAFSVANWGTRVLLDGALQDVDGLAFSLRGVGAAFECDAFLERRSLLAGAARQPATSVEPRLLGASGQRAFGFAPALGARVACLHASTATASAAARKLYELGVMTGAVTLPQMIPPPAATILGDLGAKLEPLLGGEFCVFQLDRDSGGEFLPRLGFLLEVKESEKLRTLLLQNLNRFRPPGVILRPIDGLPDAYEVMLASQALFARPAITVRGNFVLGASTPAALRAVLEALDEPLARDDAFTASLDALDVRADEPSSGWVFVHPTHFVESFSSWMPIVQQWPDLLDREGEEEDTVESVRTLVDLTAELLDDPDVAEALRGTLIRFEDREDGTRIRAVGP